MAGRPRFHYGMHGGQGRAQEPRPLDDPHTRMIFQHTLDYFDHYRIGQVDQWAEENAQGLRQPIYSQMAVPRTRPTGPTGAPLPRDRSDQPEGVAPVDADMGTRRRYGGHPNESKYRRLGEGVEAGKFGIVGFTRPLGLELVRVLGKGGGGIACLFALAGADGTRRHVVVKSAVTDGAVEAEMVNMHVSFEWR